MSNICATTDNDFNFPNLSLKPVLFMFNGLQIYYFNALQGYLHEINFTFDGCFKLFNMHQKLKIILTCLFVPFIQIFFAQVTITIPTPNTVTVTANTEHRKPLGTYFGYERTAIIYKHSELGMYGQINAVAVYCDSIHTPGNVPLNLYVKETTDSAFVVTSTVANETSGATLVYSGTIPSASFVKNQWVTVNFTTPFTHATSKPVEFIFETNATGTGNEGVNGKFFSHYPTNYSFYTSQYWNADNTAPTTNGIVSSSRPNMEITITAISSCSGTPNAGTTISTSDTLCFNNSFVLSLQGNTSALGLTYQWQDSVIGSSSFTNISLADSTTLLKDLNATTWYRCAVTCSGQTAYSTNKQVTLRNFMKCYCTNLGGGCSNNTAIDSVAIEGTSLVNGLTGCSINNYTLYPTSGNTTTTLNQGSAYVLDTRYNGNVSASFWIDYNRNGVLESVEWKQICTQSPSVYDTATVGGVFTSGIDSVFKTSFSVPSNAQVGLTLMRVRSRSGGNANDTSTVCDVFGSGETEDYYVYIDYPLGIAQVTGSKYQVLIYPNPATNQINVAANFMRNENVTTSLYNINDALISQTENKFTTEPLQLDVSTLEAGIYFLKISTKDYNTTKKIIITK